MTSVGRHREDVMYIKIRNNMVSREALVGVKGIEVDGDGRSQRVDCQVDR